MTEAARLSVSLVTSGQRPFGQPVLVSEGRAEGRRFEVVVTDCEIHFAFAGVDGPAFAIDLNRLVKDAVDAIETRLFGQQRNVR
jgi:hypothetical protein